MTFTIEQIEEKFKCEFSVEELEKCAITLRDHMTNEETAEMYSRVCDAILKYNQENPEEAEAFESFTPLDRILFAAREVYIRGALYSLEMFAAINKMSLDALKSYEQRC